MKQILCSKKYSGILWAVIIAAVFTGIQLWIMRFLSGTPWYLFSSFSRFAFGFLILFVVLKLYGKTPGEVLSARGSKAAFIAGSGFILYFLYYLLTWLSGIESITGLTAGLLFSRIIMQQLATGFYEELNYRVLILEGYFYGDQTVKHKMIYAFLSFFLFGAVHVVTGLNMYRFLQTGTIGFAFAVMYLKSGNVLIPMILHFLYDIFANLTDYATWNNSPLFINLNSIFDIVLLLLFVTALTLLLRKGKDRTLCRG